MMVEEYRVRLVFFQVILLALFVTPLGLGWAENRVEHLPLKSDDGSIKEPVLEAFLAPGEFPGRRFVHMSRGDEALYSLDSSLSSTEPFAELHPERLNWPDIAGLPLRSEQGSLKLKPSSKEVDDDVLDKGYDVRWVLQPIGQRFNPDPYFAFEVLEAEVIATQTGQRLLFWQAPPPPSVCSSVTAPGHPNCDLKGIGQEARALALSPDGKLLALAHGGLRPRLEVYDVEGTPRLYWQSLFGTDSGGAVEVAFSADGRWVVALTGIGRMHRFEAVSGGRHLSIPSRGRTARTIPPGRIMAVAGKAGEVNLWYLSDGTIAWRLPPRQLRGPIDKLAASGDGRRFATLEYDKTSTLVRVWEVNKRAMLVQIEVDPYTVADIALDKKGETLFLAHEKTGLLKAAVKKNATLKPVGGSTGARCRGRLQWIHGLDSLSCAVKGGQLEIDTNGRKKGEWKTNTKASDWAMAGSRSGKRMAAVGSGHLLIWWNE